jgi:hypothetical protein
MITGASVDLLDISGSAKTGAAWTCGYFYDRSGTFLYRNRGTGWELVYDGTNNEFTIKSDSLSGAYVSVYAPDAANTFVASSAGVFKVALNSHGEATRISFTGTYFPGFPHRIRGQAANDWFIVGDYNFLAHYNGSTLHQYGELMDGIGSLKSVDEKRNIAIAVGVMIDPINSRGIAFVGKR